MLTLYFFLLCLPEQYGRQLHCNYQLSQSAPRLQEVVSQRCESEASLVAMDFSGKAGGRVIQNAWEAQSAEKEEGQAWRVRMVGWRMRLDR